MDLKDMFSVDFQKAMKRVSRGSQKGSVSEHPTADVAATKKSGINGKNKFHGNFSFYQPKKEDKAVEEIAS